MDIFKQKNYLIISVIILIILNIGILSMMWLNESTHRKPPKHPQGRSNEQEQISSLLKKELNFNDDQIQMYLELRNIHREQTIELQNVIQDIKRKMFDEVILGNSAIISDSLLSIMLDKQGQIEKITFQHFIDLKNLCNPEQQKDLQLLLHKLLPPPDRNDNGPPHTPGEKENRPPRPEKGEHRPPPR